MEKSCQSTGDSMSSINSNNNNTSSSNPRQNPPTDNFLKHLNKISHKISKPTIRRTPPLPNHHHQNHHPHLPNHQQNPPTHISNHHQNPPTHISNHQNPPPHLQNHQNQPTHLLNHHHNPPTHLQNHQNQPTQVQNQPTQVQNHQQQSLNQELQNQQQQQQQPPVYNINKSDFRDVVQKLTGSPAHHDRFSTPPPIQPPKPPSSRLQRIRPPPLAHVSNRPPPPLTNHPYPSSNINPNNNNFTINNINNTNVIGRQITPLSPLPPFPSVHGAAESPISAYMRYLQSSTPTLDSESKRFSGFSSAPPILSPKWNNHPNSLVPPPPQHQHHHHHQNQNQQFLLPSPNSSSMLNSQFMMPNSPLGFGRVQSPRSPYPLLSPNLLFSPTSGQLGFPQFPPSPRLPMLSPRWRGL